MWEKRKKRLPAGDGDKLAPPEKKPLTGSPAAGGDPAPAKGISPGRWWRKTSIPRPANPPGREIVDHVDAVASDAPDALEPRLESGEGGRAAGKIGLESRAPSWMLRTGLLAAGSLVALIGAASYPLSGLLIRPRLKRLSQLKSPHIRALMRRIGIEIEDIVVSSFDATKLYGWWIEAARDAPTVVVLHGVKKNRTDVIRTALLLRRAGFNVLVFDGRAHGNSGGRYVTYGFYERRDVEAALDWLVAEKKIDRDRIGLAGESMGAAIALQVAASNPWLRAVWADSPFASLRTVAREFVSRVTHIPPALLRPVMWTTIRVANYRGKFDVEMVDPLSLAARIQCPVYMVHGTADQMIAPWHSQKIYGALAGKKEIWIVEGAAHARAVRVAKQEYCERITSFFAVNLTPLSAALDLPR